MKLCRLFSILAISVATSLSGTVHSATMFETMAEASRLAGSYRAWAPTETVAVEARGVVLTIRLRLDRGTSGWATLWAKRICTNQPLRRFLAMGGELSVYAEDSAAKRFGEMGFGATLCRSIGMEIPMDEDTRPTASQSHKPNPSSGPMPAPTPLYR